MKKVRKQGLHLQERGVDMWLTSFMAKNIGDKKMAPAGEITGVSGNRVEVNSSSRHSNVPVVTPYGFISIPPVSSQAVVITSAAGDVCAGVMNQITQNLEPGEVMIRSAGGASILLKNDGRVLINGKEVGGA